MKILITAPFSDEGIALLEPYAEIERCGWGVTSEVLSEDELIAKAKSCAGIITEVEDVTAKVIASCPELKFIGCTRAVPRTVDVEAATKAGLPVFFAPGRNAQAVTELTILLLIGVARKVFAAEHFVQDKKWHEDGEMPYLKFRGVELADKVVGIVGLGAIGRKVAAVCQTIGAKVIAFDPYANEGLAPDVELCSLKEVMQRSDFITVHCAVTPETKGLISREMIALMKPTAFFVNTSRGVVVDEEALIEALEAKRIGGAALDVFTTEPLPLDSPFMKLDNCILLPHIGGASHDVVRHHSRIVAKAIASYLKGEPVGRIANPEVLKQ